MIVVFNGMKKRSVKSILKFVLLICVTSVLVACATPSVPEFTSKTNEQVSTKSSPNVAMETCLAKIMQLKLGTWDYTGVIARMNGSFTTYVTRSVHGQSNDGTLSFQSFGGDVYDESISYSRLVGSQMLPVVDGVQQETGIQFTSCNGPDREGRYFTSSEYTLPLHPDDPAPITVTASSTFSESGSYFSEDHFMQGRIVAQRAGVTVPVIEPAE